MGFFLRLCVSGNPPNCFGVFYTVLLFLGFCSQGFLGRTVVQEWAGVVLDFYMETSTAFA